MTNTQRFTPRVQRFTPLQRTLHWLVAVCILTMLFIGVGMASSVAPKYLTLAAIHKTLGIAILILALAVAQAHDEADFAVVLLHVAAALFYALIRRDGVFDAMGPALRHDEVAPAERVPARP